MNSMLMDGPRGLKEKEFPSATKLDCTVFQLEKLGIIASNLETEFPLLFSKRNLENLRVFVDGGEVISLVGISIKDIAIMGCRTRVASIGGVCTYSEYRNKGLATRLMEDATRRALEKGASVMLVSRGRGLYRRLGCINAGLYSSYLIERDTLKMRNEGLVIREHDGGDLVELVRLHQSEPIRFIRPYEDFKEVLAANRLCVRSSKTYVISSDKRDLAYVCLQLPEAKGKPLVIRELAGSREAILRTLGALMDDVSTGSAIIETPSADVGLEHLLLASGAKNERQGVYGHSQTDRCATVPRGYRYLHRRANWDGAEEWAIDYI
jgi:predicted acetyltransferase